jgi:hypothetical protein
LTLRNLVGALQFTLARIATITLKTEATDSAVTVRATNQTTQFHKPEGRIIVCSSVFFCARW